MLQIDYSKEFLYSIDLTVYTIKSGPHGLHARVGPNREK
jgi:hypothetical protein